ncbi:hypothetical protein BD780_000922 [Clostridium tetanomorphum]|uniref:Uncharacterized protein n=1 Tax=Clostridium tetanomorphum TaxID=1553 RepID=A0A923ECZ7_CLOTT|nr:hypothetical protein [Clostridium tetanomorphum]MBC2399772.1 hypothetical protein [Clostridium tetanomorphum]MBP1864249.1 hypothetical protein [Clostridium tetanomorphum]NRS83697.1 hypothetical protein [Clostridium tetanomorphum]NRZ96888.1 hypothetical protein [Clostridium tetanomorphum]SQC02105.1 Uncharacterised protein [Clostridium tetanomorphum]
MKQYQIDDNYKAVMRRDIGDFSHGDANHWKLEIQTLKGNLRYHLHIYIDDAGNVINTGEYIPKK